MSTTFPSVSVIVPCYKAGPYLARFHASLTAQTYEGSWEAVFVDDGDPDGETVYACVTDPRCRVVRQPSNRGVSAARNRGLTETTGEIVLFADPDDELGPDWMATLVAGLEGVDCAWGGFRLRADGAERVCVARDVGAVYRGADVKARIWRAIFGYRLRDVFRWLTRKRMWRGCGREFANVWCRAFRRSAISGVRFDETLRLNEDAIFLAEVAAQLSSLRILGDTGYIYETRPSGAVAVETRERKTANKFALRDARRRLDPRKRHWRGTFWLSAFEVWRDAGFGAAWRYLFCR